MYECMSPHVDMTINMELYDIILIGVDVNVT
jgi:hypothetical protein